MTHERENSQRWANRAGESGPRVEQSEDLWRIRALEPARQVLRARHATTQAGFTAEYIPRGFLKHHPILFSDGPLHDEQRRKLGRFFAPETVRSRYTGLMNQAADSLLAQANSGSSIDLDELALYYSVEVTAQVVGLTHAPTQKMAHRLVRFFNQPPFDITKKDLGRTRKQWAQAARNGLGPVVKFYFADVLPAIRERKRNPREDVISHLIEEGYTHADILVECATYGTAGMVTTREFITMAAWHLLENDDLRQRYVVAGDKERHAILHEIMRLEPVVGHLYRRMQEDLTVHDGDASYTLRSGDLVDMFIRPANADPDAVGDDPMMLCPERSLPKGVPGYALSFGDGAHKCPGQPLAILETDALLHKLLSSDVEVVSEPELGWDDLIAGYTLRGMRLRIESSN